MKLDQFKLPVGYRVSFVYQIFWILASRLFLETWIPWPSSLKCALLRLFGAKIGKRVVVKPAVKIKRPDLIVIGNCSWIGERVWIENIDLVSIGSDSCVSQGVKIINGSHRFDMEAFDTFSAPVEIGDRVWVGAFSLVMLGVRIDSDAFVKAGSILTSGARKGE